MMRRVTKIVPMIAAAVAVVLTGGPAQASTQIPGAPQDQPIALKGATIHPVSGPPIKQGVLLFAKGKIVDIGTDIDLPRDVQCIRLNGKHLYPALINPYTTLGRVEIGAIRQTHDNYEVGVINPNLRAEVATDPDNELIPTTRANGIGHALTVPLSSGLILGTSAVLKLDGWTWEDMTLRAPVGMHIAWPTINIRHGEGAKSEEKQWKAIEKRIDKIRQAFNEARAYKKARMAESSQTVPVHETNRKWEAMIPVLKNEIPVMIHAERVSEIRSAVEWAEEEGLDIVLVTGQDAWRVAPLLERHDIPVILKRVRSDPTERRWEPHDNALTNPRKLHEAGVKFSLAAGTTPSYQRNLPYHAAAAAASGLPKEVALKAVTLHAAEILGVAERIGSLEAGKDASLIVTDGDPFEVRTQVTRMYLRGREVELSNKQTELYEKYRTKYKRRGLLEE